MLDTMRQYIGSRKDKNNIWGWIGQLIFRIMSAYVYPMQSFAGLCIGSLSDGFPLSG